MLLALLLACATSSPEPDEGGGDDTAAVDADGDGSPAGQDCADDDPTVFPGAEELCNERDDDCDGAVDEGTDRVAWYRDLDGDGYGDPDDAVVSCLEQVGRVPLGTDCDDADDTVFPGAAELCDGVDQDCDGVADQDLPTETFWLDRDGDGFGGVAETDACAAPDGWVDRGGDCDDEDPDVFPGAVEDWTDERDGDCDGDVERAAPATAGLDEEVQLSLAADTALRVISVADSTAVTVHVDLSQPTRLVLAGPGKIAWTVDDPGGVVEDVVAWTDDDRTTVDGAAAVLAEGAGLGGVDLDDPRITVQLAATADLDGDLASWHGATGVSALSLVDDSDWAPDGPWPWCEGLRDEAPLSAPGPLDCPDLSGAVCLTATDDALVAFDESGTTCRVADLPAPPSGATLRWSGDRVFLATGEGQLTRVTLSSSAESSYAWRWPEAVLGSIDGLVLVPGADLVDVDPDIAYAYDHWGDLQCGGGANLVARWGADLTVSALAPDTGFWWTAEEGLMRRDLRTEEAEEIDVSEIDAAASDVNGLFVDEEGVLWVLGEGTLWTVEGGAVTGTWTVPVDGRGLHCSGG